MYAGLQQVPGEDREYGGPQGRASQDYPAQGVGSEEGGLQPQEGQEPAGYEDTKPNLSGTYNSYRQSDRYADMTDRERSILYADIMYLVQEMDLYFFEALTHKIQN